MANDMTAAQLIKALIEYYEAAIPQILEVTPIEYLDVCIKLHIHSGVCLVSTIVFKEDLESIFSLEKWFSGSKYWFTPPYDCISFEAIPKVLKARLDKLKTIYNELTGQIL